MVDSFTGVFYMIYKRLTPFFVKKNITFSRLRVVISLRLELICVSSSV